MSVVIKEIKIDLDGKELVLSLEEVKKLKVVLDGLLEAKSIQYIHVNAPPTPWYKPVEVWYGNTYGSTVG